MTDQPLSVRIRCRTLGHDWIHHRKRRERECHRCGAEEEYSVDERHTDDGAKKGEVRYRIEDERLYIEEYVVTGWSKDTEEWRWFPIGTGPATEENLKQLTHEIEQSLETEEE